MRKPKTWELGLRILVVALCLCSFYQLSKAVAQGVETSKLYVVYMGKNPHPTVEATHAAHHIMLSHVFENEIHALESLVYHYKHAFNGFSAMLTETQAHILRQLPEVVSVFESKRLRPHITRSMSYIGLSPSKGLWPESNFGEDVIIGVIDSGIWPESEMFNDAELGPIPARWNGSCVAGELWDPKLHCNKKIIGARWYNRGYLAEVARTNGTTGPDYVQSARDMTGHGTHCASTAAGAKVENATVFSLAAGAASGAAPAARIAVYKVLWTPVQEGYEADILAAFDQAVLDGVDILSVSIGGDLENFYETSLSIGSYHAAQRGILVSISAGNFGPEKFTSTNISPWELTVAANTIDRFFLTDLQLWDGTIIQGRAVKNFNFTEESFPIVDAATVPSTPATSNQSRFCEEGSLDIESVIGAVIVCEVDNIQKNVTKMEETIFQLGAKGLIIVGPPAVFAFDSGYPYTSLQRRFIFPIPAVGLARRTDLDAYLSACKARSGCVPTGIIRRTETVVTGEKDPVIATFSSRGPNSLAPSILKPDLTAPGVDILAAWPETESAAILAVKPEGTFRQKTKFALNSGTSMSCPHVSGIAALVKAKNPFFSAAAIKSALITSAIPLRRGSVLDYGGGEINVLRAGDPGLVYDIAPSDYTVFLCGLNYTNAQFQAITSEPISICPNTTASLNYPSLSFNTGVPESSDVRTLTNVGDEHSNYSVTIVQPGPVAVISVSPSTVTFTEVGQKLSYTVSVQIASEHVGNRTFQHSQGFITWTDEGSRHTVTSPVSFWNFELAS